MGHLRELTKARSTASSPSFQSSRMAERYRRRGKFASKTLRAMELPMRSADTSNVVFKKDTRRACPLSGFGQLGGTVVSELTYTAGGKLGEVISRFYFDPFP